MREEIANVVFPVLSYGLHLKQRLDRGAELDLLTEQSQLKKLLKREGEARQWSDYGGHPLDASVAPRRGGGLVGTDEFLGSRYALVCWLDEIFIDSSWVKTWDEQKLETALYDTNDRAHKFWQQARRAESRMDGDALEVFYLCVMLGFRGEMRERPEKLRIWRDAIEGQIGKGQVGKWPGPQERPPVTNVPPLRGRQRLQRVLLAIALGLGLLMFVLAYTVVTKLN